MKTDMLSKHLPLSHYRSDKLFTVPFNSQCFNQIVICSSSQSLKTRSFNIITLFINMQTWRIRLNDVNDIFFLLWPSPFRFDDVPHPSEDSNSPISKDREYFQEQRSRIIT